MAKQRGLPETKRMRQDLPAGDGRAERPNDAIGHKIPIEGINPPPNQLKPPTQTLAPKEEQARELNTRHTRKPPPKGLEDAPQRESVDPLKKRQCPHD